jgi:hypothetical protein
MQGLLEGVQYERLGQFSYRNAHHHHHRTPFGYSWPLPCTYNPHRRRRLTVVVVVVVTFIMFGWGKKKAQTPETPAVEEPKVPRLDLSQVIAGMRSGRGGGFEREDETGTRRKGLPRAAGRADLLSICA